MRCPKYSTEWWLFEAKVRVLRTGEWVPGFEPYPQRLPWRWQVRRALFVALWPVRKFRALRTKLAVAEMQRQMKASRRFLLENDLLPPELYRFSSGLSRREQLRRASARLAGMYRDGQVAA